MGIAVAVLGVSPSTFWGFAICVGGSFAVVGYGLYQVADLLRRSEEKIAQLEAAASSRADKSDTKAASGV
jgi:hypothetical protein